MFQKTLDNGLEVVIQPSAMANIVAIQCWVGVGSRFEEEDEIGIAHVLEHMIFKGTKKHGVGELSRLVESFGGDINAFTSFDHTAFYLTLSSDRFETGLDLLVDAILNSTFDPTELAKEIEVVCEEINQSEDGPGYRLGASVFKRFYNGTPVARPVIGFKDSVKKLNQRKLRRFHKKWYVPSNIKVVVAGNVSATHALSEVQRAFSAKFYPVPSKPKIAVSENLWPFVEIIREDIEQPRLEIGFTGPQQSHEDQVYVDIGAFILGSGDSSRLAVSVRDESQSVSSISSSIFCPNFPGIFSISALPEPDRIIESLKAIGFELGKIVSSHPITEEELKRTVVNLKADRLYAEETVNGIAHTIGNALFTDEKLDHDAIYFAKVSNATCERVTEALKRWIKPDRFQIFALLPEGFPLEEHHLYESCRDGVRSALELRNSPTSKSEIKKRVQSLPQVREFENGVKLVYRKVAESPFFSLVGVTEGGLRADGANPGISHCISNLLTCATESLDYHELVSQVESSGSVLAGFSGKDSLGIKLQCFNDDFFRLSTIWADCLLRPRFPDQQWEITKLQIEDEMRSEVDSSASTAGRKFQSILYNEHPYSHPIFGLWEKIRDLTVLDLHSWFSHYRDSGPWTIAAVGSLDCDVVLNHLEHVTKGWKPSQSRRRLTHGSPLGVGQSVNIAKAKSQSHLVYGVKGISWDHPDRYALDVLSTVLGGSGGRLFLQLRDQESLAYSVSPVLSYGVDPGAFGVYMSCAPDKVERARESIDRELTSLCHGSIDELELERAKNYLIGGHESDMQRGDSQALTMALMELYGIGFDDFLNYSKNINAVSAEAVQRVATSLWKDQEKIWVEVGQRS